MLYLFEKSIFKSEKNGKEKSGCLEMTNHHHAVCFVVYSVASQKRVTQRGVNVLYLKV